MPNPLIIGGGVALVVFLLTRESAASKSLKDSIGTLDMGVDLGTIEADIKGTGVPENVKIVASEITMTDSETGECRMADDGFGNPISCQEHDKRMLAMAQTGGIGSEVNF